MSQYEVQMDLLNALLQLEPNSSALRWERSTLDERWGNALLKRNRFEAALEKYRASVVDKLATLAIDEAEGGGETEGKAQTEAQREAERGKIDAKRLRLAQNYLGIATLETIMGRRDEARVDCETAIQTLESATQCKATKNERNALLQEARELLANLANCDAG